MRPLLELRDAQLAHVVGVMTDIDDTLTSAGALEAPARTALQDLGAAGIPVVAITGRPMGWSLAFLRPGAQRWPLHCIVAENGAVA